MKCNLLYLCYKILYYFVMWKENLYQPVEILIRNHEIFPIAEHQHSFFEMVYVHEGTGRFYVKESDCKVEEVFIMPILCFLFLRKPLIVSR